MGMTMTLAMAYEVITQAVSSNEAARLPLIVLMDTFTIVVSINSIMAEMMTVIVMTHFLKPVSIQQKNRFRPGINCQSRQKKCRIRYSSALTPGRPAPVRALPTPQAPPADWNFLGFT